MVGRVLRERGLSFDAIIASPATRARETVERFAIGYESMPKLHFEPAIYLASTGTLIGIINALPDDAQSVMIVGHNPGFHDIVLRMTKENGNGLRGKVCANYPTGAFSLVDFAVERWADVEPSSGEIRQVIFPRELQGPNP